jgi:hypothetical protein
VSPVHHYREADNLERCIEVAEGTAFHHPCTLASARLGLKPSSSDKTRERLAKLKAILRKATEFSVDGLWAAIGRIADDFTPAECANYFSACGYDPE